MALSLDLGRRRDRRPVAFRIAILKSQSEIDAPQYKTAAQQRMLHFIQASRTPRATLHPAFKLALAPLAKTKVPELPVFGKTEVVDETGGFFEITQVLQSRPIPAVSVENQDMRTNLPWGVRHT
jgi:hypothetical protein